MYGTKPSNIPSRRRPAVWIAAALASGIALGTYCPTYPRELSVAGVVLALLGIALFRFAWLQWVATSGALVATGITLAQLALYAPADHAVHLAGEEPQLVRARVSIAEPPVLRTGVLGDVVAMRGDIVALEDGATWRPASGRVLVRLPAQDGGEIRAGDEIQAIGELSRIASPMNPGEYDWQRHFARDGVHLRFAVNQLGVTQVTSAGQTHWLQIARLAVREAFATGMPHDERRALLQALLLGDNDELLEEAWADFRASGTAHHLSISGMHIAILAGFVVLVGRIFMLHPRNLLLLAVVFAVSYASMTRSSPPVVRSVLLCVAIAAALLFRRNTDPLQCLCLAIVAMLLYNPLDLFNPGFQLSFGAVAALMLYTTRVTHWFLTLEHEHDRMARLIMPPTGLFAAWHWCRATGIALLSASLVAHAVSLPLIAFHFGQVNPWAVPGSILLAPVVTLSLVVALLKMLVCLVLPAVGELIGVPALLLAATMRESVSLLAQLPGAQWSLGSVPPWLIVPYLALVLTPAMSFAKSRWWGLTPALALAILIAGSAAGTAPAADLRLTLLSVGNGGCALIRTPEGRHVMVDCGAARGNELFARTIDPFLRFSRIRGLDALLITHDDFDHRSALPEVTAHYAPRVYMPLTAGPIAELGSSVSFEVLAPHPQAGLTGNDASAVIRIAFAGRSILFTGDIEEEGIQSLLRSGKRLKTDVLIAPHHGAIEDATPYLLDATRPRWVVCSSSSRLWGTQERFDRLVEPERLLRTGKTGAISITIGQDGSIGIETHRTGRY